MPADSPSTPSTTGVCAAAVLVVLVATGALAGAALADDHTREEATHLANDEAGDATFEFLEREDHRPGAEDVGVRYTLKGGAVFDRVGASDGIAADRFVVETDAVDHDGCIPEDFATFGVDRGDDGPDGHHDEDLLRHVRQSIVEDHRLVFDFYDHEDLGGDPPVVHADDRIVLEFGDDAAGGGCADTTEEVGFYGADLFLNGTGPAETDRADETYGFTVGSEHTYVCGCEDEEEATERIGYPPGPATPTETRSGTAPATDTPASTPTSTERPRTPTPDGTPVLTATVDESVGDGNVSANASVGEDGVSADVSVDGPGANRTDRAAVDPPSPTPGDGPGFGAAVAAATLLGCATLRRRRRGREDGRGGD